MSLERILGHKLALSLLTSSISVACGTDTVLTAYDTEQEGGTTQGDFETSEGQCPLLATNTQVRWSHVVDPDHMRHASNFALLNSGSVAISNSANLLIIDDEGTPSGWHELPVGTDVLVMNEGEGDDEVAIVGSVDNSNDLLAAVYQRDQEVSFIQRGAPEAGEILERSLGLEDNRLSFFTAKDSSGNSIVHRFNLDLEEIATFETDMEIERVNATAARGPNGSLVVGWGSSAEVSLMSLNNVGTIEWIRKDEVGTSTMLSPNHPSIAMGDSVYAYWPETAGPTPRLIYGMPHGVAANGGEWGFAVPNPGVAIAASPCGGVLSAIVESDSQTRQLRVYELDALGEQQDVFDLDGIEIPGDHFMDSVLWMATHQSGRTALALSLRRPGSPDPSLIAVVVY